MNELAKENRLERHRWTRVLWGWSYSFEHRSPALSCQAMGLEIGITLAGTRTIETTDRGTQRFTRHTISTFNLGEPYTTYYEPHGDRGREIGFLVRSERIDEWTAPGSVLFFPRRNELLDVRLFEVGCELASALDQGTTVRAEEIEAEVRGFVERKGELAFADGLELARLELHRTFAKALYMRHFAEIAGVHEETFARKFAARYGATPAKYRVLVRLKEAALLIATRRDMSLRDVARKVGFEDVAYFHRAFVAQFGTTPMKLARQFCGADAA